MRSRHFISYRLDLLSVGLLAVGSVLFPRALFGAAQGSAAAPLAAQAALLLGCLAAAFVWRRDPARAPRIGAHGSALAAVFALSAAIGGIAARPAEVSASADLWPLIGCAIASAAAGVAVASALFAHRTRYGEMTAAYVFGATAGILISPTPELGAWAAAAAGAGAFLLAIARQRLLAGVLSLAALSAAILALAVSRFDLPLGFLPAGRGDWEMGLGGGRIMILAAWSLALAAFVIPSVITTSSPQSQRRDLARLHVVAILWGCGAAIILRNTLLPASGADDAERVAWGLTLLMVGTVAGGLAADAWPVGIIGLRRALAAGTVGATLIFAAHVSRSSAIPAESRWILDTVALLLGGALVAGLVIPAAARAGGVFGPAHAVWAWACGAAAALASHSYLTGRVAATGLDTPPVGIGLALILLAMLSGYDISISPHSLAGAARWIVSPGAAAAGAFAPGGRRLQTNYPLGLRLLKFIAYAGCTPWWITAWAVQLLFSLVRDLALMAVDVGRNIGGSLAHLLVGHEPLPSSQPVQVSPDRESPVVDLAPPAEPPPEKQRAAPPGPRWGFSVVDSLAWPFFILADGIAWAVSLTGFGAKRATPYEDLVPPPIQAPEDLAAEMLDFGPPPDVVPGAAVTREDVLRRALSRRDLDPVWRKILRATVGIVSSASLRAWLAPDVAEPWDDRVLRTEVIGPRGRRFELLGRLWQSPRRLGCVVTVPTLASDVDKGIEIDTRRTEVRSILKDAPEELRRVLLRAAFRTAIADLMVGSTGSRTVVCKSPEDDLFGPHRDRHCELRQDGPGDRCRCRSSMQQDATRGASNPSACDGCDFPEIWMRCSNLKL
ncbi:MAG TPA: hypothetical protein VMY87_02295, partial [Armatimonadota bacterium]|nr:hypothetical protein [Armatimonadota bacterium]